MKITPITVPGYERVAKATATSDWSMMALSFKPR